MELPGGSLMCPQTQLVLQHLPPSIPGLPTKELCPTTASTCAWVHVLVNNLYGHDLHAKLALLLIAGRIFYHKELCLEPVWLTTERKAFSSINWTTTKSIHIKGFEGLLLFFFFQLNTFYEQQGRQHSDSALVMLLFFSCCSAANQHWGPAVCFCCSCWRKKKCCHDQTYSQSNLSPLNKALKNGSNFQTFDPFGKDSIQLPQELVLCRKIKVNSGLIAAATSKYTYIYVA